MANQKQKSKRKIPKSKQDDFVYDIHEYNIDYNHNHIYLLGEDFSFRGNEEGEEPGVEYVMANRLLKNLNLLINKSDDPIVIHMKSCGGYWEEGIAIYDTIKLCPNHITILSYTHARSMTSLIFQAANRRIMMPHSTFMFHEGTFGTYGTSKQALTELEQLKISMKQMLDIYVESMKAKGMHKDKTKSWIRKWLKAEMDKTEEVYLSPKETIALGFADEIYTGKL